MCYHADFGSFRLNSVGISKGPQKIESLVPASEMEVWLAHKIMPWTSPCVTLPTLNLVVLGQTLWE